MASVSDKPGAEPLQLYIELKQLVTWEHDENRGKNKMNLNEALLEEVVGESENYFISMVVVGQSARRNTMLLSKLIASINEREGAIQNYHFDESKFMNPRTGVWICSRPLELRWSNTKYYVLLLEVQCTYDEFAEDTDLHNIFELGLLVSSVFILNFMERIEENILRRFEKSFDFVQGVPTFPSREYYQEVILSGKNNLVKCPTVKHFQSLVLFIGDITLDYKAMLTSDFYNLQINKKAMAKSSKCSREFILNYFHSCEFLISVFSPDSNAHTIPEVSILFESTRVQDHIKNLFGVPLQFKFFKPMFKSIVTVVNTDVLPTSEYITSRSNFLKMGYSNINVFIHELAKQRFFKRRRAANFFWKGVLEKDLFHLNTQLRICMDRFATNFQKYSCSGWC